MAPAPPETDRPLRIAALVKQIPTFEAMALGDDGRLVREGLELEMSAYCRRAVAKGVLARRVARRVRRRWSPSARRTAEDVLREAIASAGRRRRRAGHRSRVGRLRHAGHGPGAGRGRALEAEAGPFDLVLVGRNSVDADTGQVPPELAQLLDLPFATGVRGSPSRPVARTNSSPTSAASWTTSGRTPRSTSRLLLSTAERLIDPCKIKDPTVWAGVDSALVRRVRADELGEGPWGQEASPTWVGEVRLEQVDRAGIVLDGPVERQVAEAAASQTTGAARPGTLSATSDAIVPEPTTANPASGGPSEVVVVVLEPDRDRLGAERPGCRRPPRRGDRGDGSSRSRANVRPTPPRGCGRCRRGRGHRGRRGRGGRVGGPAPLDACRARAALGRARRRDPVGTGGGVALAVATWSGLTGDAVGLAVEDGRLLAVEARLRRRRGGHPRFVGRPDGNGASRRAGVAETASVPVTSPSRSSTLVPVAGSSSAAGASKIVPKASPPPRW